MRAHALVVLLVRHLGSYLELGAAAAAEYRSVLSRRLLLLFAGLMALLAGIAALWVTGLLALWDTPWRLTYALASALALLAVAAVALSTALSSRPDGPKAGVLKGELSKDLELLQQWKNTL